MDKFEILDDFDEFRLGGKHVLSRENKLELASEIIGQISGLFTFIVFFLLDAFPLSKSFKRIITIIVVIFCCVQFIEIYFMLPDYQWNPFTDFEYFQVSFKSIILSCFSNLIIFIAKPICSDAMRFVRRFMLLTNKMISDMCRCSIHTTSASTKDHGDKGDNGDNGDIDDIGNHRSVRSVNTITKEDKYQRCTTVYKRLYLKWYTIKGDSDKNCDETKMSQIISLSSNV